MSNIFRLQDKLCKLNIADCFIISGVSNMRYLLGLDFSEGLILVTKEKSYFLVDFRYYESAKNQVKDLDVILFSNLFLKLEELIKKHNISSALMEYECVSLSQADKFKKFFNSKGVSITLDKTLDDILSKMRMIKTDKEIEKIKKAQEITELAYNHVFNMIDSNITEKQIALELEFFMRKNGADRVSFDLIVVSGKNSSLVHGVPTDKKINAGDFITIDIGAVFENYHSDMTRTVAYKNVTDEQRKVYNIVLKAQLEAIKAIKPQVSCKYIDSIARNIIKENGYGEQFGHVLGHSVGIDIHESPVLSINCETLLEPNMVVTVEPGIYIENKFGVRIEDMVVVTKESCINLVSLPKELIII